MLIYGIEFYHISVKVLKIKRPCYYRLLLFGLILQLQKKICAIRGNNIFFFIFILIFTNEHIKMIMVWFLQGSVPNKDVFFNQYNLMYGPGQLCLTFRTAPPCHLKTAASHVAISINCAAQVVNDKNDNKAFYPRKKQNILFIHLG